MFVACAKDVPEKWSGSIIDLSGGHHAHSNRRASGTSRRCREQHTTAERMRIYENLLRTLFRELVALAETRDV